jgi:hypothetical protein
MHCHKNLSFISGNIIWLKQSCILHSWAWTLNLYGRNKLECLSLSRHFQLSLTFADMSSPVSGSRVGSSLALQILDKGGSH